MQLLYYNGNQKVKNGSEIIQYICNCYYYLKIIFDSARDN